MAAIAGISLRCGDGDFFNKVADLDTDCLFKTPDHPLCDLILHLEVIFFLHIAPDILGKQSRHVQDAGTLR